MLMKNIFAIAAMSLVMSTGSYADESMTHIEIEKAMHHDNEEEHQDHEHKLAHHDNEEEHAHEHKLAHHDNEEDHAHEHKVAVCESINYGKESDLDSLEDEELFFT
jgi:ABC-type Zn2+ transport system substrate-binding protein/surface adhesin